MRRASQPEPVLTAEERALLRAALAERRPGCPVSGPTARALALGGISARPKSVRAVRDWLSGLPRSLTVDLDPQEVAALGVCRQEETPAGCLRRLLREEAARREGRTV